MLGLTAREDEMAGDDDDRRERLRCLILARCPEVSQADLDDLVAAESDGPGPMVGVMDQIADIIETLEARLERLENGGSIEDQRQLQ